ncbi:glycosyltransferase family 4 protein [Xenococcus sp. PCC 7305]|uniref:glycosyltransferase n=1 Tax=Xenococcus sp. PCC 7305 TaxID=102125 RepID=UPI00030B73F2|nr:glycosyltransferase family 4 protein [Xenococcus sp. PCC 7305]
MTGPIEENDPYCNYLTLMKGKNILVLSPTPSHPQDAGNRKRIFALTKSLQELGATIYFVYCPREWDHEIPKDSYDGMNQCWDYFFVAYPVQSAVYRTDDEYFELDAWWDVGIEYTVNWIKLAAKMDIVLCNYIFYSKVLELFDDSVTKVIDTHDIISNRNYLLDRKLGYRDFFYVSPESEKAALDRAHLVLSIKEDESNWFKCLSQTPVLTIGHLEPELSEITNREIDYNNIKLGFIGSANPINVRNLESFLDQYLTICGDRKSTFIVGGKVCDALDGRFQDQVQILGKVKDVSEFYDLVDIVVLPFEFSTGLKIKTVEALSWFKPCIGTINAFEGLGSNCQYHSFKTINELALGVEEITLQDTQHTIAELQKDSKSVFLNYANSVKEAIKKLYQSDWKLIKNLQYNLTLEESPDADDKRAIGKKKYNFNIITNVNFWNAQTNEELWIAFWINSAKQLGELQVYRSRHFENVETDKLKLYHQGLVDNVHHREFYQIIDLFKIKPDENQIFIHLLDFSSIVVDDDCIGKLKNLKLGNNNFLSYFFNRSSIDNNETIKKNVCHMIKEEENIDDRFYLWDLPSSSILKDNLAKQNKKNILLTKNPIILKNTEYTSKDLEQIVIGVSCLDKSNQAELNKLIHCCQYFLPQHFELVIISDLNLSINSSIPQHSANKAIDKMSTFDLFICIEETKSISFLIYLCICNRIPIYTKNDKFIQDGAIKLIKNFTFIPTAYQSFLEQSIVKQEDKANSVWHYSQERFLEYWLPKTEDSYTITEKNIQEFAHNISYR